MKQQQKEIKKKEQSDSSRHVGLAGKKEKEKEKEKEGNSATVFTFSKTLFRQVSLFAQRQLISVDEVELLLSYITHSCKYVDK